MGKKLPTTPRSRVRSALRQVWLRSRERAAALKTAGRACEQCGAKGKDVRLEVHHMAEAIPWDAIIDYVFRHLLVDPAGLECLCADCHKERHHD